MPPIHIKVEKKNRIGIITIDAPPLNISTREVKDEIREAVVALENDHEIAVIIITGAGDKAFSVGSDIKELRRTLDAGNIRERAEHENSLNNFIENLSKPTIAAIQGYALGGGLELALACDLRVCSADAQFAFPEIKLALFPGGGGSERLPLLIGYSKALELMLTGEVVGAQEARQMGLVNRVAAEGSALEESVKLAESITRYSLVAIKRIKKVLKRGLRFSFSKANQQAILDSEEAFSTHDANEGINAFLEKREAKFTDS